MNDTGFVGIVGKASGDFMREFTTAWRQGVPVAPPGQAAVAQSQTAGRSMPTGHSTPTATATQAVPAELSALNQRLVSLEAKMQDLERSRLAAVIYAHAVHSTLELLLKEHLSIETPSFQALIQASMSACSALQDMAKAEGEEIDPEQLIHSDPYKKLLHTRLRDAAVLAAD